MVKRKGAAVICTACKATPAGYFGYLYLLGVCSIYIYAMCCIYHLGGDLMASLVETVKTESGAEVFESEIHAALAEYAAENDIKDFTTDVTQMQWNHVLIWLNKRLFRGTNKLKVDDGTLPTNKYDQSKLLDIFYIYRDICYQYGKVVNKGGFLKLTGVSDEGMASWNRENSYRFNAEAVELNKSIRKEGEESLAAAMISTGRNPLAFITILNHEHGWNMPGANNGMVDGKKAITADELPTLSIESVPFRQIAQDHTPVEVVENA